MFVEIDTLNVLVPFALVGFVITMGVAWYYCYKFVKDLIYKFLTKYFPRK
jgi:hypothetical protein